MGITKNPINTEIYQCWACIKNLLGFKPILNPVFNLKFNYSHLE
jgi:hypothetical protein